MVLLQRSLDQSVQRTLQILVLALCALIALSVVTLLGTAYFLTAKLDTVYADRVVPLDDLQRVERLLSQAIPSALADASEGPRVLPRYGQEIEQRWSKYKATYLTHEEAEMVQAFERDLAALRPLLAGGFAALSPERYQRQAAPLLRRIAALSELQVRGDKETLQDARQAAVLASVCGLVLLVLGIVTVLLVVHIIANNILRPLGVVSASIASLAEGAVTIPDESRILSGDFAEVGDQLRNLRSFVVQRGQLMKDEHERIALLSSAQNELMEAEKLASLGGLVAGFAHELNTPLGVAIAVSSGLDEKRRLFSGELASGPLRRSQLDAFVRDVGEAAPLLSRNLARAAELVGNFKQVAVDRTAMQRRRFDLSDVVTEMLTSLRPVYGRHGTLLVNDVPKGVELDSYPGALGQVIGNLVSNAVLHGLDAGAGRVRVELLGSGPGHVELSISDNGKGMSGEVQSRVFEPFFTTRLGKGGTGLGLPIVRSLVMGVLGGKIGLSSEAGQGSRFVIHLPLLAPMRGESRTDSDEGHHAASGSA